MRRSSALFFQLAIVVIGIVTLAFLLWEPHLEGRNANATIFAIYFKDPFLAYVYVGSTPFFVGLYRAFAIFESVKTSGAFSHFSIDAMRSIQRCAFALIGFVAMGVIFILRFGDPDDRPAGLFMSLLIIFAASIIVTATSLFTRKLKNLLPPAETSLVRCR
jgi:hypothetical protein